MTETRPADALLGTLVDGRYRVRDWLARGGMATVYRATDERLERMVALKMIHPAQAADPSFLERFSDEAKAIARLVHPNVVAAYDQGTHQGLPYLVMEYVPGRTLREILSSRRRLTPLEALAITEQMLAAVAAAHRAGLVHRDVKPENVLVAEAPSGGLSNLVDSVVKVTDFGLAQAVAASTAAPGDAGEPLLATVAYVAPELVRDGRADPRSDVYAVGIVLFEMLTGRVPFDGGSPAEVAWQHVDRDVPRPATLVAGLPPSLDALVVRATRREPTQRHTDAGAMLTAVQAVREELTSGRARPRPPADATVVISPVSPAERPAWARLPETRGRSRSRSTRPGPAGRPDPPGRTRPPEPGGAARPDLLAALAGLPRRRLAVTAGAAALVLLLVLGAWWFGAGRWMPAPELVGMSEAEATAAAQRLDLRVRIAEPRHSEEVPVGHVLAQEPDDRVVRGGTLTLTLSLGPERYPLPDVVGADLAVARRQLEALGLTVVEGEPVYSSTVPQGRVVSADPEVGTEVSAGDQVTLAVSQGPAPITVPVVVGRTVNDATQQLQQLGLVVTTQPVESNRPQGEVLSQDPPGNSGAEPGDTVTLEVSQGPPTQPVPELVGVGCQQATQQLTEAGFTVALGSGDRGQVRLQLPSAGTGLPPGSQVTIWCVR